MGNKAVLFKYLKGCCIEEVTLLGPESRAISNGLKLQEGRSGLDTGKSFLAVRTV